MLVSLSEPLNGRVTEFGEALDPDDTNVQGRDYQWFWTEHLSPDDDTITSVQVTLEPPLEEAVPAQILPDNGQNAKVVAIWLKVGSAYDENDHLGKTFAVTCQIQTFNQRNLSKTKLVRIAHT